MIVMHVAPLSLLIGVFSILFIILITTLSESNHPGGIFTSIIGLLDVVCIVWLIAACTCERDELNIFPAQTINTIYADGTIHQSIQAIDTNGAVIKHTHSRYIPDNCNIEIVRHSSGPYYGVMLSGVLQEHVRITKKE